MRARRALLPLYFTFFCITGIARAQASHVDFSTGAGFSEPLGRAVNNVDTGWNLDFRGGYKPNPHLALDLPARTLTLATIRAGLALETRMWQAKGERPSSPNFRMSYEDPGEI